MELKSLEVVKVKEIVFDKVILALVQYLHQYCSWPREKPYALNTPD